MTTPLYSVDTHALFWHEFGLPQLSPVARRVFDDAGAGLAELILHPIVLAEFSYVLRKEGLEADFPAYYGYIRSNPLYRLEPMSFDDLNEFHRFSAIPEMHDRLIAIQAARLGATLITRDRDIQACPLVRWVW